MSINKSNPLKITEIEELLRSIQPIPGESFHRKMENAPWNAAVMQPAGGFSMKQLYRFAIAATLILILFASFTFTPAGKVLAGEIIRFFNPAAGKTFPLPPAEFLPMPPTHTPAPTRSAQLLPAGQVKSPTPKATATAFLNLSTEQIQNLDSITAQSLVDYPIQAPGYLPEGYLLLRTFYDDKQDTLNMEYTADSTPEYPHVRITQGKNLDLETLAENLASEEIAINGRSARLVHASWTVDTETGQLAWYGYPGDLTVFWQSDGISISIQSMHQTSKNAPFVGRDELIQIAESMQHCSEQDYSCSVRQAGTAAGFIPWQFPQAPANMSFKNTYYSPSLTAIWYSGMDGELGVLQSLNDFSETETSAWFSVPEDVIKKITVAGQPAEYVNGSFINYVGTSHATWEDDSGQIRLRWKNGDYWFEIVKWGTPEMQPQELADLAARLTADADQIKPDEQINTSISISDKVYHSIAELRNIAKFPILEPSILPEGMPFSHARLTSPDSAMLFYGDFMPNKINMKGPCLTISQIDYIGIPFDELYHLYPKEAILDAQVEGRPAKIIHGIIMMNALIDGQPTPIPQWIDGDKILTLYWETTDKTYSISYNPTLDSAIRMKKEDMIKIAESLQ